jgi:hypothetical protein
MNSPESQRQIDAAAKRRARRGSRMCANGPTPPVPPITREWVVRFTYQWDRDVFKVASTYRRPVKAVAQ